MLQHLILPPKLMSCEETKMIATGIGTNCAILYQLHIQNEEMKKKINDSDQRNRDPNSLIVSELSSLKTLIFAEFNTFRASLLSQINSSREFSVQESATEDSHSAAAAVSAGASAATTSLHQAFEESNWPRNASLRLLHELWYEGNKSKNIGPYKDAVVYLPTKGNAPLIKSISHARGCIRVIDNQLPFSITHYLQLSAAQKDASFNEAIINISNLLKEKGHKASVDNIKGRLQKNNFSSIYENEFKYLRK
jgi:hypothetical protein